MMKGWGAYLTRWLRAGLGVGMVAGLSGSGTAWAGKVPGGGLIFTQEPVAPGRDGAGSRVVALGADGDLSVLTPGFAAAADPCVSFDGKRVLFAARLHAQDPWDIWIMDADGSRQRRLTRDMGECRHPVFLPRAAIDPPEFRDIVRWIGFISTAPGVVDERGRGPLTSLYAMNLEPLPGRGTVIWRTSFGLGGDRDPTVLADGRVVFSSWQRRGYALMTITWAGENPNPLYGCHDADWSQLAACESPVDRRVVFVERRGAAGDGSGRLAAVSMRRPLHSHVVLSRGRGRYRTPHVLPDGRLLVSWAEAGGSFGVYLFDDRRGRPSRCVWDDPQWHEVDAQALAARPEPVSRIPLVESASVLDIAGYRSGAQLQCMDAYASDRPRIQAVPRGAVKEVRLIQGVPVKSVWSVGNDSARIQGGASERGTDPAWPPPWVRTRALGRAPVEADGSFYVNIPGNVPFYVETLDAQGKVLGTMRAWTWVRSRNQRGCVGCHENPELAPENRATDALVKARPRNLMGADAAGDGGSPGPQGQEAR